jgi:8-oxo-dGTP diphosphatase
VSATDCSPYGRCRGETRSTSYGGDVSFRLAAYAVCLKDGEVLLARAVSVDGESCWTLPGGRVEHCEDPFDAVLRELGEETGSTGVVERLIGIDSRVIPASEARLGGKHQNVGIFYSVRITDGDLRPEPNGDTAEVAWTAIADVAQLKRSSLVDIGIRLAQTLPATGHVDPVPVGGLVRH